MSNMDLSLDQVIALKNISTSKNANNRFANTTRFKAKPFQPKRVHHKAQQLKTSNVDLSVFVKHRNANRSVIIGNVAPSASSDDIKLLLESMIGPVFGMEVDFRQDGTCKNMTVTFSDPALAASAVATLNRRAFDGYPLSVIRATMTRPNWRPSQNPGPSSSIHQRVGQARSSFQPFNKPFNPKPKKEEMTMQDLDQDLETLAANRSNGQTKKETMVNTTQSKSFEDLDMELDSYMAEAAKLKYSM